MRFAFFSAVAVVLLAWASIAATEEASDVINLTASTFQSLVNPEPLILVEFFAPWCGHCKALAPHYEKAATSLKEFGVKLAKVDCVEEVDLCQEHRIEGYPTLKVFRNGTPTDYTGPRKDDGIVSYMIKQSLPAVSNVNTDNHEEFKTADRLVVVAYLSSSTEAPAAQFNATAEKHRDDYLFGIATDPEVIAAAKVETPVIVVYRSFDERISLYPYPVRDADIKEIETWLKELSIPILDEVHGENYALYAQSGRPLAYLFVDPSDQQHEATITAFRPVAAKYKGQINFVWIDAVKFGEHAKALNLPEPKWPSFVIQDLALQLKYPFDQNAELGPEAMKNFADQFVAGKLEPQLKSEPIPEKQDENVFHLVGKQFEEIVFDDSKDVFVEFYASWCGHCKRLKPTWDSLGDKFADVKDRVIIAKLEAQENDLPPSVPFRIAGFPTLKFKPAGSREFLDYEGDRSLESLVAFVEQHAKNSLEPKAPVDNHSEQVVLEAHDEL